MAVHLVWFGLLLFAEGAIIQTEGGWARGGYWLPGPLHLCVWLLYQVKSWHYLDLSSLHLLWSLSKSRRILTRGSPMQSSCNVACALAMGKSLNPYKVHETGSRFITNMSRELWLCSSFQPCSLSEWGAFKRLWAPRAINLLFQSFRKCN